MLDLVKRWAGKHSISPAMSSGTLMVSLDWQAREKDEDGEMAETKAASGEKEATATVTVKTVVHLMAYMSSGHRRRMVVIDGLL